MGLCTSCLSFSSDTPSAYYSVYPSTVLTILIDTSCYPNDLHISSFFLSMPHNHHHPTHPLVIVCSPHPHLIPCNTSQAFPTPNPTSISPLFQLTHLLPHRTQTQFLTSWFFHFLTDHTVRLPNSKLLGSPLWYTSLPPLPALALSEVSVNRRLPLSAPLLSSQGAWVCRQSIKLGQWHRRRR
jgi:hypothetical protein